MLARDRHQLRRQQTLAERADEMRAVPPRSEAALWAMLRARKLGVEVQRPRAASFTPNTRSAAKRFGRAYRFVVVTCRAVPRADPWLRGGVAAPRARFLRAVLREYFLESNNPGTGGSARSLTLHGTVPRWVGMRCDDRGRILVRQSARIRARKSRRGCGSRAIEGRCRCGSRSSKSRRGSGPEVRRATARARPRGLARPT